MTTPVEEVFFRSHRKLFFLAKKITWNHSGLSYSLSLSFPCIYTSRPLFGFLWTRCWTAQHDETLVYFLIRLNDVPLLLTILMIILLLVYIYMYIVWRGRFCFVFIVFSWRCVSKLESEPTQKKRKKKETEYIRDKKLCIVTYLKEKGKQCCPACGRLGTGKNNSLTQIQFLRLFLLIWLPIS